MTTRLFANKGAGGTHGDPVTALTSGLGGDNAFTQVLGSGWTYSNLDVSPAGGSLGCRRTVDGTAAYLRPTWTPTDTRNGVLGWFYWNGVNPGAHVNILRLENAAAGNVANVYLRSNGRFRAYLGSSSISESESPVWTGTAGWYAVQLIADHVSGHMWFRVDPPSPLTTHTWDGAQAVSAEVPGARLGEPQAGTGWPDTVMRVGSWSVWGSIALADGWIPPDTEPYSEEPDPPPATTAVSHYNTAEGLTINDLAPVGDGIGTEGHRLSARLGSGGSVRVTSSAIHGSRAYRVQAGNGQSAYVQWGFSARQVAFRAYLDVPSAPPASTQVMILRNEQDDPVARLALTNTSQVLLQCVRGAETTNQTLGGSITFPAQLRLEVFADVEGDVVKAAWGYAGEGREGTAEITTRDLGGVPVTLAQVGKMHGTSWAADFILDDLALNIRALDHIGAYAASYDLVTTVAADLPADEPGTIFELEGFGTATWTQVPTPGMPSVPLVQTGTKATGVRPYTVDGGTLEFDYGGATQRVGVLYATETEITVDGEVPIERELIT